jgi:recombination protein RecR
MARLPEPIAQLIASLSKLPGIGPRSAERLALHLVQTDPDQVHTLAECLITARQRVQSCEICGALTETQPCHICCDPARDASLICLVERPVDIISVEKSGVFRGKYHVLGGKISPVNGVGPEELRIQQLEERLTREPVKELILALGSDVEGDATSFYLAKILSEKGVRVSRIAHGLPVGGGLEFADELTLSRAIEGRRELTG